VARGTGVGSDHRITAVLLDPHQGCLSNLARLDALEGQHNDRFAVQCASLYAIGRFILLDLFAV
jgi:hypothetical protein